MVAKIYPSLSLAALVSVGLIVPVWAENLDHTRQLLATKQCPGCDLTGAGLVLAQLSGADLSQANLAGANLSQANLAGANLSGANLSGVTLAGANLTGANLAGANLAGASLQGAYLSGASFTGVQLNQTDIRGAIGLPQSVGSADEFYRLAMEAGKQKRFELAIEYFNSALLRKPDFPAAYLGRGVARGEIGDRGGAIQDMELAAAMFESQGDTTSAETTQQVVAELKEPQKKANRGSTFGQSLVNVLGGLLQLFLVR
jgi:tetratricopeptide (TPR) repeat protein